MRIFFFREIVEPSSSEEVLTKFLFEVVEIKCTNFMCNSRNKLKKDSHQKTEKNMINLQ